MIMKLPSHLNAVSTRIFLYSLFVLTSFTSHVYASSWLNFDDLALFDLIDEVNGTFYEFMSLNQNASVNDIRKSYRQLSLKLHPDKNASPDAAVKFRQLVAISDVLKDDEKRAKYDHVLIHGMPDWRSGIYYLRKARKLGLVEMTVIVSLILTVGHYLCQMASYYEQCWTYMEVNRKKERRSKSKSTSNDGNQDTLSDIPIDKPHIIWNSLPVKFFKCNYHLALLFIESAPILLHSLVVKVSEKRKEEVTEEEEVEVTRVKYVKQPRQLPEYSESDVSPVAYNSLQDIESRNESAEGGSKASNKSSEWTQEELNLLVKLSKKFPPGCNQRWERISEAIGRAVGDVTQVAKTLKSGELKISNDGLIVNDAIKNSGHTDWSQNDQKLLEEALQKYPRGTEERWEQISLCIPGKSKVIVMVTFFFSFFYPLVDTCDTVILSLHFHYSSRTINLIFFTLVSAGRLCRTI